MLTLLEALDELNSKSESELTLDYLEELAKKVSIEDPHANAVTYLYSGGHMDGSGNWISARDTYIKPEINNQDVRLIDRTHLGQFLDSPEYNEALKLAYINEGYDSVAAATMASNYTRAIPHKDCTRIAQSDFSSDCTTRTTQGCRLARTNCAI